VTDTADAVSSDTDAPPRSYREVLRNRRLATLLSGDVVSKMGDGMTFVGLPLLALELHGGVPAAVAIALVTGAPYIAPMGLSLYYGLGHRRFDTRVVMLTDSALHVVIYVLLGSLALAGTLTLPVLLGGLLLASLLRLLSASARRLAATGMVEEDGRLAVNGLIGTTDNLALYVVGPALGGVLVTAFGTDLLLLIVGFTYVALLAAAAVAVPRRVPTPDDRVESNAGGAGAAPSGWAIMRRSPVVVRLALVVFLFDLFYGPVEVALPLLVTDELGGDGGAYGALWTCFGVGALAGALLTNQFRRVRPELLLVAVIGGWACCAALVGSSPNLWVAGAGLALGGAIYGPFLAVAYTLLQGLLRTGDQQPVFTLWGAMVTVAMPLGLAVGGPLITAAGARGGIWVSALITALLAPAALRWLRRSETPA
jgi:MFS family permease